MDSSRVELKVDDCNIATDQNRLCSAFQTLDDLDLTGLGSQFLFVGGVSSASDVTDHPAQVIVHTFPEVASPLIFCFLLQSDIAVF